MSRNRERTNFRSRDDEATSMGLPRYPCPAMASFEWGVYVYEQYVLQRDSAEIPGNEALGERLFLVQTKDYERFEEQLPGGIADSTVTIAISIIDDTLDVWELSQEGLNRLRRVAYNMPDKKCVEI